MCGQRASLLALTRLFPEKAYWSSWQVHRISQDWGQGRLEEKFCVISCTRRQRQRECHSRSSATEMRVRLWDWTWRWGGRCDEPVSPYASLAGVSWGFPENACWNWGLGERSVCGQGEVEGGDLRETLEIVEQGRLQHMICYWARNESRELDLEEWRGKWKWAGKPTCFLPGVD